MSNKAHAAVLRRLAERYGGRLRPILRQPFDFQVEDLIIEVETTATLQQAVQRLQGVAGRRFIAVTNREALSDALALTRGTPIGVMDPWGEIVAAPLRPLTQVETASLPTLCGGSQSEKTKKEMLPLSDSSDRTGPAERPV